VENEASLTLIHKDVGLGKGTASIHSLSTTGKGSGQLQDPAALNSTEKPAVSIGYELKWTVEKI
jgi:hypothetical protein